MLYTDPRPMKILLISTNRNNLPMPVMPIGACIIAHACERAGHSVHLLDLMFAGDALPDKMQDVKSGIKPGQQLVANALVLEHTIDQ